MSDETKNRWYKLHMSTAIILGILALGFVVANCHQSTFIEMRGNSGVGDVKSERGWPFAMMSGATKFRYDPGEGFFDSRGKNMGHSDTEVVEDTQVPLYFDLHHALLNGGALLGALILGMFICEVLNRILHSLIKGEKRDETIYWH